MKKCMLVMLLLLFATSVWAADLGGCQFVKIAAQEQKAVVKNPDGKLQVVKVGTVVAGDAEIVEIAAGRIVLRRQDKQGLETVIVRLDAAGQRIERYRQAVAPPAPVVIPLSEEKHSAEGDGLPGKPEKSQAK